MDELFLILKENQPYKIAQHLQPYKLLRQLVSNTHPKAHPETRVSEGFKLPWLPVTISVQMKDMPKGLSDGTKRAGNMVKIYSRTS